MGGFTVHNGRENRWLFFFFVFSFPLSLCLCEFFISSLDGSLFSFVMLTYFFSLMVFECFNFNFITSFSASLSNPDLEETLC
jgi:hypothetical protein